SRAPIRWITLTLIPGRPWPRRWAWRGGSRRMPHDAAGFVADAAAVDGHVAAPSEAACPRVPVAREAVGGIADRRGVRAGHRGRTLAGTAGRGTVRVPRDPVGSVEDRD